MLKKQNRLEKVQIGSSQSASSPLLTIKFSENNLTFNRFGFVISKKIDKSAVIRNSLKRKLSVCLEENFDNIKTGYDFVLYPRKELVKANKETIDQQITEALKNKDLIK